MATPRFKACIFDLDGTLINSLEDLAEGVNRMLDDHGYPRQLLSIFPHLIGDGVHSLVKQALPQEVLDKEDIDARVADYQKHYQSTWNQKTHPYEGIVDVLNHLKEHGIKVAVLSNKPQPFTELCCQEFFPNFPFDAVLGARPNVPRKPDPQAALEIAQSLGVTPQECAFVGDSKFDILTAVNAKMFPVGVLWGFRDKEELVTHGAKALASTSHELKLTLL